MAQGKGAGRPLKFKSVKQLQESIDAYFADCDPHWVDDVVWDYPKTDKGDRDFTQPRIETILPRMTEQKPYLITGLALALDTSRETLLDYESGNRDLKAEDANFDKKIPRFSDTIKKAKLKCQSYAEASLFGPHATGPIFSLKNNYDWRDEKAVDLSSGGKPIPLLGGLSKNVPANDSTTETSSAS